MINFNIHPPSPQYSFVSRPRASITWAAKPALRQVLQISVEQLAAICRGDLSIRWAKAGFRYLMENGVW